MTAGHLLQVATRAMGQSNISFLPGAMPWDEGQIKYRPPRLMNNCKYERRRQATQAFSPPQVLKGRVALDRLAQFAAQDLADRRLGQGIAELDVARNLVARE